ncbi:MAG: AAA family ATPase [Chitinophagaceae bacterium]|nr:AAA family ATPase [Chitinophagaceae bacterium]
MTMFDLKDIQTTADHDPRYYIIAEEALRKAVDMSIWLQKPLLLTGAPGTGKTQLAAKVAFELFSLSKDKNKLNGFAPFRETPLVFDTKTTCTATDLFYSYDAIGHFQKRHIEQGDAGAKALTAHPYIKLNALGKAILQTYGKRAIRAHKELSELQHLSNFEEVLEEEPMSSVVLIDEIDKAPRDFPNDLLIEIERYKFTITELGKEIVRAKPSESAARIIVFMTSNFEKNLPDAFLRRCLFYHIPSPGHDQLLNIVCERMGAYMAKINERLTGNTNGAAITDDLREKYDKAIRKFESLRTAMVDKQPATAELLEWIKVLEAEGFFKEKLDFDTLSDKQKNILRYTLPVIAKSKEDLERSATH